MSRRSRIEVLVLLVAAAAAALAAGACRRNARQLKDTAPSASIPQSIALSPLQGGPATPPVEIQNPYEGNAYGISEGQRLYEWYNCGGCHFRGGGGIGPPLMDRDWIYGGQPGNIFASIIEGRPNGMPSWRGRIPTNQVWEIVAYVQSLDADRRIASPPGAREEHLQAREGRPSR
jgi:cytochrome c oxidase cbb3-type subunit III